MSEVATPPVPLQEPAAKPTLTQQLTKWVSVIAGLIVAVLGVVKLMENFTLPACDSSRSLDVIRSIFKDKNLPPPTLTDAKAAAGEAANEKLCTANYELPNEKGVLDYKVFWEGRSATVMITKVN
ncbi:MAG: hypothetical protein QOJ15_9598 [Bradyrhizobium sp.]|jgi:hypothetical protein|nr:hypothetical protein [Bradyrhizobium sp.]